MAPDAMIKLIRYIVPAYKEHHLNDLTEKELATKLVDWLKVIIENIENKYL